MWVWFPEGAEGMVATLRRGTVQKTDDSGTQQILKKMTGLKSESFEDVYRPQPHGFSSHAPAGSEGLFLALGGRSDRLVALGFEHKDYRVKDIKEGNAVLYDDKGNVVFMRGADGVSVRAKEGKVEVISEKEVITITSTAKSIDMVAKTDITAAADGKLKMVSKADAAFGSSGAITYIGGDGTDGAYAFVATEAGLSTKVKAKV